MAWRIHAWSAERNEGLIVSPHFGPLAFGPEQNVFATTDFVVGEEVIVEVSGRAPQLTIERVIVARQRQPECTEDSRLAAMNGYLDAWVEEETDSSLRIGAGDCCAWCGAEARVTFIGKVDVVWGEVGAHMSDPLFRMASPEEIAGLPRPVPADHRVYCIVTGHGDGPDGPHVYVVARDLEV